MPRGLELLIAQTILQGFDAQYGRFLEVTSGAQQRFEQADWHAVQQAMKTVSIFTIITWVWSWSNRCITNGQSTDAAFLLRVKEHYTRCCRITCAGDCGELLTPCTVGYLTTARLLPERLIFSPSQSAVFVPFCPLAKDFHPDHGWESR